MKDIKKEITLVKQNQDKFQKHVDCLMKDFENKYEKKYKIICELTNANNNSQAKTDNVDNNSQAKTDNVDNNS